MRQPKISIIIPIYNVEKYLNRCIDSVVNQSLKDIEIILVDDGSPDNCPQLCDEWAKKDSRIKVIHKENAGLGMARNTGMQHWESPPGMMTSFWRMIQPIRQFFLIFSSFSGLL